MRSRKAYLEQQDPHQKIIEIEAVQTALRGRAKYLAT